MQVRIKKLSENAVIPKKQKLGDAGFDLTCTSYKFENGRHIYGTGLAFEIPNGFVGLIFPRSSIHKYDMRLCNSVGVVDENFRGEVKFIFESNGYGLCANGTNIELNTNHEFNFYNIGDRVGQLIIMPYPEIMFKEVDELSETNRGQQGWGSSGA